MATEARLVSGCPTMVDHTPGAAVAAGDVVLVGDMALIAHLAIEANKLGALASGRDAIYEVTGDAVIAAGKRVYWDDTAKKATETAGNNKLLGYSVNACGGDDQTFHVRHVPAIDLDT